MKLDTRILKGKRPLTCFDSDEAKQFIGKECYFSDSPKSFEDLDRTDWNLGEICQKGTLKSVSSDINYPFNATKNNSFAVFRYCLPLEYIGNHTELDPDKTPEEALNELSNFLHKLSTKGKFAGGPNSGNHKQAVLILRSFQEILMAYLESKYEIR